MMKNITVKELKQKIDNNEDFVLIDCRTHGEYSQGFIKGSILMPLQIIQYKLNEIDKDKPVIIYCRTAYRSVYASNILLNSGFSDVTNVLGGIVEWEENGYEVLDLD